MSETIRVTKSQLDELFSYLKRDPKTGKWKRKAEAARKFGFSRPTIDKILKLYPRGMPEKPKKVSPKYYETFEQTECAKKIRELYHDRRTGKLSQTGYHTYGTLREAFKIRNKDPLDFDLQDFLFFWGTSTQAPHPDFIDPQTNTIEFNKAVHLRFAMRLGANRDLADDPRFTTKGLKRLAGRKKHMYLETPDVIKVSSVINEPDTLVLTYLGVILGGRFSAFERLRVANIHRQALYLDLYEPKVKKTVEKDLIESSLNFVWQYVIDFNRTDKLFLRDIEEYNELLKKAGKEAGLAFPLTTHILKHTCVTLMSLYGVDMDVVSEYVGTDPKTLIDFYRGGGRDKIRAQILGLPRPVKLWKDFIAEITPFFVARYNSLKPSFTAVNGIKKQ